MQKVLQTGNSLAVVIPSRFIKVIGVKRGDQVEVETYADEGKMTIIFSSSRQLSLELSSKKAVFKKDK